ncbi:MAG: MFS transporter [Anaerolineales bacterium]|nr:MFS transporter [Anaerolineales bacterium]
MRSTRLLTLVGALFFVGVGLTSPAMTLYLEDLGASFRQISLILTSFTLTALISNYASGYLSDRLGRRKPLLVGGLLLMGVAYVWLARVPTANLAWPVRILEGIGTGAYATLSLAMMGDLLQHSTRRGRGMGLFRGVGSFSFAMGAFAGSWVGARYATPAIFMLAAAFFVAAALIALLVSEVRPETSAATFAEKTPAAALPVEGPAQLPRPFLAGVVLWTTAVAATVSMWPNAMSHLGYSNQAISALWGLAALVEFPGMQGAGILSVSIGRAPLLAAGAWGIALTIVGWIFLAKWLVPLIGVQIVRGLAYGSYMASAMTFAAEHASQATRGSVSGVFTAASSAGQLAGVLAGGFIVEALGFNALFVICAVVSAISGVLFWGLRRTHVQQRHYASMP